MHATRTWILVADAAHAKAFVSMRPGDPLQHVPDMDMSESVPPAAEVHRHEPGSGHNSVGSGRYSVGPTSDPRREMKHHFANHVAERLEAARARGAFDRLVIACPPAMLGDLRAAMPPALSKIVIAEIAKDLVKTPAHELLGHFKDLPAVTR